MRIRIFVEGGGDSNALRTKCRQGFAKFFEKAGMRGCMPSVVACGSRNDAYDSFRTAIAQAGPDDFPLLLVDSEEAVRETSWEHLARRDQWDIPPNAHDDHAHLMVECMEAWFLTDRDALVRFYGQGFVSGALPDCKDIETIPKRQVLQSLRSATRATKTKGEYGKGAHSFDLLAAMDPSKVCAASPHAKRMIDTVVTKTLL